MVITAYALSAAIAIVAFLAYGRSRRNGRGKLPPGPKPWPLLGNVTDFPPDGTPEHLHWLKHKDAYGPISAVAVMGMTLILVHDKKIAHDLLEQSSSKTSGRPSMVMANKLCGYEAIVVCQSYTPTFRRYRKFLHQEFGTRTSSANFRQLQEDEVKRQLVRGLREPEKWLDHYKTTSGGSALKMAYGYNIEQHKPDMLVDMSDQMMKEFSLAASPMAWLVDIIPALQYLPESFPGTTFQKTARRWRRSVQATAYLPYEFVQRQRRAGTNRPSYVSRVLDNFGAIDGEVLDGKDEEAIIWSAASLYGAVADTAVITLTTFTLAMTKFPEVQRRAQEEIDRVVGTDRLPTIDDRENLPYVDAVVKEAMRWWPIASMGFPHTVTEDIEYDDYHIPEGAMIVPAVWWFLHDPEVYAEPDKFDPSRFLAPRHEPDPESEAFGYGRRKCPGRFFADDGVYLNLAMTLATMNIRKAIGADGKEIDIEVKPKPGVLTHPTDFGFSVEPRTDRHRELIQSLEKECPFEPSDSEMIGRVEDFKLRT